MLAHGAGADMNHEYMGYFAEHLSSKDLAVARFNFRYADEGRRAPDKQPVLEETYRKAIEQVLTERSPERLFIGGKSMGGRIGSHLVASGAGADGLVYLGYPLHPPGRPDRLRDEHLATIEIPQLFVEGTRDPFCPLDTLAEVIAKRRLKADVVVIEDGDHSLKVRKSSGRTTRQAWDEAIAAIDTWIRSPASA
ncbi:MAG: alpha/beta hydrolase family protein [Actinomycetota bacterium]